MEKVAERCCGLEVHKKTLVTCASACPAPVVAYEGPGVPLADASPDSATPQGPELRGEAPGTPRSWAWADLLRRGVDLDGRLRLLATIEDPQVLRTILAHLGLPTEVPFLRPLRLAPRPSLPTCRLDRAPQRLPRSEAPPPVARPPGSPAHPSPASALPRRQRFCLTGSSSAL